MTIGLNNKSLAQWSTIDTTIWHGLIAGPSQGTRREREETNQGLTTNEK